MNFSATCGKTPDRAVIVLTSAILQPQERAMLGRASRIMSKSDLSSRTLTDAIEAVLRAGAAIDAT